MTDKIVILSRGLGTRMRKTNETARLSREQEEIAATGVKALMPIDRPFLDYVLTAAADAGYRRVCLVIGPEHDALRRYYGSEMPYRRLEVSFAVQAEPRGTADAVAAAEGFADGDAFAAINSDNYYPVEALRALRRTPAPVAALFERASMLAMSNIPPDRLTRFAVVRSTPDGFLERIIEKPDQATLDAMPDPVGVSMNCWLFTPRIFESCRSIAPSPRGELEITDAVQHAVDVLGERFRLLMFRAAVLDLTGRADVPSVAGKLANMKVDV